MTYSPVRKIGKGRRGNRGRLGAPKAGGRAEFESTLERDFYLILEFDPSVRRFTPQPLVVRYLGLNGRKKRYVPDTLVEYQGGRPPCLFEVKYVVDLVADRAEYRQRFRAARQEAKERGWTFSTVTERFIRSEMLVNINFLRPFRDSDRVHSPAHLAYFRDHFSVHSTPRASLEGFSLAERGEMLPALWTLVAKGELEFSLVQRLSLDTPLRTMS
ncbi:TnsA endonuclease N-terminal domain-containing protein [Deinococcus radiomollis]|uniref:TnsA endonuclease N-terminal domain-containing protein n=1 Tax=Deinococcus radiomollis TaxID=468916 RepID=UPI003891CD1E